MKNIKTIMVYLLLASAWSGSVVGQQKPDIETITLNPHTDVRIVFEQLKEQKLKHGKYTYYHRNIKIIEGSYLVGKKHGNWRRFFQNGSVFIDAFYLQGKKHGNWTYYHLDKSKMASINFNRGARNGEWTSWYRNSELYSQLTYKNDSLLGMQKIYYQQKDLELDASSIQLHISVNIRYEGVKKNLDFEKYYANGKLFEKFTQWGNKKVGMYTSFYYSALPWKKMKYEDDGRLFSIYEYNNPVGRDANRGSFWDGNGELISYYRNGDKHTRINYANGLKDGKFIEYEEDKKELVTGYYNDDIPIGTWTFYKKRTSKKEVVVEKHFTGKDTATAAFYTSDLQARSSGELIKGKRNGIWRTYYPNGHLEEEMVMKMDFIHGTNRGFTLGDQIDYTGGYYYGLKVGEWKYYNDFGNVIFKEKFITQASADENYLFGDSCKNVKMHINFDNFLLSGKSLSLNSGWKKDVTFLEDFNPIYPQFVPRGIVKRPKVEADNDIGLFLETLNPRKIKVKGDKDSPHIGIAMVVLYIDEFGFVENMKIVRGIHSEWDQKILDLFTIYQYWEPTLFLNQPTSVALQLKVPIVLEVVKKMR